MVKRFYKRHKKSSFKQAYDLIGFFNKKEIN